MLVVVAGCGHRGPGRQTADTQQQRRWRCLGTWPRHDGGCCGAVACGGALLRIGCPAATQQHDVVLGLPEPGLLVMVSSFVAAVADVAAAAVVVARPEGNAALTWCREQQWCH